MNREITSPPHDNLSFKEMNKKQAEEYFEWYVSQIPLKIELLEEIAASDGVKTVFDFTPESLNILSETYKYKFVDSEEGASFSEILKYFPHFDGSLSPQNSNRRKCIGPAQSSKNSPVPNMHTFL